MKASQWTNISSSKTSSSCKREVSGEVVGWRQPDMYVCNLPNKKKMKPKTLESDKKPKNLLNQEEKHPTTTKP